MGLFSKRQPISFVLLRNFFCRLQILSYRTAHTFSATNHRCGLQNKAINWSDHNAKRIRIGKVVRTGETRILFLLWLLLLAVLSITFSLLCLQSPPSGTILWFANWFESFGDYLGKAKIAHEVSSFRLQRCVQFIFRKIDSIVSNSI